MAGEPDTAASLVPGPAPSAPDGRRLGGMAPDPACLPVVHTTDRLRADGRPAPAFREQLRRIPDARNAFAVVSVWLEFGIVAGLAIWWGNPIGYALAFLHTGRTDAQLAALMHESAHRLLFSNRRANDVVGRWLLGYPIFTSTDAYRRVHMAHHRREFGPDEPDIPLYAGYPITRASFRRKLTRDALGRTGLRLLRDQARGFRSPDRRVRRTLVAIVVVQLGLLGLAVALGRWWLYPVLWLLPFLTVWRVINRLRSIAEHGGMRESDDRRVTTHSVRQTWPARLCLVPFHIGWHLAHHVDAGVSMWHLPRYHRELAAAGYVTPTIEYPGYRSLWRALRGVTSPRGRPTP